MTKENILKQLIEEHNLNPEHEQEFRNDVDTLITQAIETWEGKGKPGNTIELNCCQHLGRDKKTRYFHLFLVLHPSIDVVKIGLRELTCDEYLDMRHEQHENGKELICISNAN